MTRIAVFCGSRSGADDRFAAAARDTGTEMARRGLDIVYGGSSLGLMGVLADAALAKGGRVIGVLPSVLKEREVAHRSLTELRVVGTMHERKALMAELADGFLALPGGIGTLDETVEILSWRQLKLHAKPYALLNVAAYFDPLLAFLGHAVRAGFLDQRLFSSISVSDSLDDLLNVLTSTVDR